MVFLFELIGFGLILTVGKTALAADPIELKMQVGIPGAETGFGPGQTYTFNTKDTKPIAQYIHSIYKYAIGVVGILATVVMMIGGVMWIMSGGSPERAGEAKAYISASLTGLVLTLCSYLILATVNPALVNFKISSVTPVTDNPLNNISKTGCCDKTKAAGTCDIVSKEQCDGNWFGAGNDIYGCNDENKCQKVEFLGCCIVGYDIKTGLLTTEKERKCYSNQKQSACSGSASLFNVPGDAAYSFNNTDPTCKNIETCNYIDGVYLKK